MVEFCQFLGLTGYYGRFIPLFTDITKLLNKLTQKGTKFLWSAQYHQAFEQLKKHFV